MTPESPSPEHKPKNWPLTHFNENEICRLARRLKNDSLPLANALAKALFLNAWVTAPKLLDENMVDQETVAILLELNMDMDEVRKILQNESRTEISDTEQRIPALTAYISRIWDKVANKASIDAQMPQDILQNLQGGKPRKAEMSQEEEAGCNLADEHHQRLLRNQRLDF